MAQDLGEDIGEYLLNHKDRWAIYIKKFIDFAQEKMHEGESEEVITLDFDNSEGAHGVQHILSHNGIESYVIGSSLVMEAKDLQRAIECCELLKDKLDDGLEEPSAGSAQLQEKKSLEAAEEETAFNEPHPLTERRSRPASYKQIEYVHDLYADGWLSKDDIPDIEEPLTNTKAHQLIRQGLHARDKFLEENGSQPDVKYRAAEMKAASEQLEREAAGRSHEKIIDRSIPTH